MKFAIEIFLPWVFQPVHLRVFYLIYLFAIIVIIVVHVHLSFIPFSSVHFTQTNKQTGRQKDIQRQREGQRETDR